ncbi:hypothetical protein SAMN06264364_10933 [Quadrisphaera granulorum]|uniref:AbiEi antitoxin C-terminal domain-containing protein n=2 Tax=Quadrisphaera granulorum TaxID=317664 RepID=A0A316A8V1_9ACTN|nr:hypothetical protein BXY45_10933 [Quadrisphaera granulorum]SZE96409.1 hypothetical protein SAMN06264364_10933 [Quadrisphaera granulorum]
MLQPVTGVYVDARLADDAIIRAQVIHLATGDDAVVARGLAAWLHGFDPRAPHEQERPLALECVAVPGRRTPDRRGLITHRDRLPDDDVTTIHGIAVTTIERTVLDTSRFLAPHMGLAVADAIAHAGLVDPVELLTRYDEWPPRQRWMARGKRCLDLCEPDTESYGESWTRLRIVDAGFPRPRPQIWVPEKRPGAYRLDMGWEELRKAIEYDGEADHTSQEAQDHDDARRDDLRNRYGWTVWPVRKGEVLGHDMAVERAVGELLGLEPQIRKRLW